MNICDPCFCQKPCRSPCSMLPLPVKVEEAAFAEVSMAADSRLRSSHRRLCANPYPFPTSQRNSPDRKPSKRILKNWDRDAEV